MATWTAHWHPTAPDAVTYWHTDVTENDYLTVKLDGDGFRWDIYSTRRRTPFGAAISKANGHELTLPKAKAAALAVWTQWAGRP